MKRTLLTLSLLMLLCQVFAVTARIQFINNSPDTSASSLNLFIDGVLVHDSIEFRHATPFFTVTAGMDINVAVGNESATSADQAFTSFVLNLSANAKYIGVLDGELNPNVYNPYQPFDLNLFGGALEIGSTGSGTDVLFYQGSPDAGVVDINETELIQLTAFNDIAYGSFSNYLTLFAANYTISATNADGSITYGTFVAPFTDLGWGGDPVTILSSGVVQQNTNNNAAPFGLFAATPAGGALIELPVVSLNLSSRVQLIHNSADILTEMVDVYVNSQLVADDFEFRHATPFLNVPAGQSIEIGIAPANSESALDILQSFPFEFISGETYTIVINGQLSESGYNPAFPISLDTFTGSHETSMQTGDVMILMLNGCTDADNLDVTESLITSNLLVQNLGYPEYSSYFSLPIDNYEFTVTISSTQNSIDSYTANFSDLGLQGQSVTIIASGYQDPSNNSDGAAFGLWMSDADGGPMTELSPVPPPTVYADVQFIHNSADVDFAEMDIYMNENLLIDNFGYRMASPFIQIPANQELVFAAAPSTSASVSETVASETHTLTEGESYYLVATGILSNSGYNPSPAFTFQELSGVHQASINPSQTELLVFHGATDLPLIDLNELTTPINGYINDLPFADFSNYVSQSPDQDLAMELTDVSGNFTLGQFGIPMSSQNWTGESVLLLTGGFNNPANNSNGESIHMWAAHTDGSTEVLPIYVGVDENSFIHLLEIFPNPAYEKIQIRGEFMKATSGSISIVDMTNRLISSENINAPSSHFYWSKNIDQLANGMYLLKISDGVQTETFKFSIQH